MWVKIKKTRVLSSEKESSGILLKELKDTSGMQPAEYYFVILLINRQRSSTKNIYYFEAIIDA